MHELQVEEPGALYNAASQVIQFSCAALVAAPTLLNVPTGHPVHTVLPTAPHCPAGHLDPVNAAQVVLAVRPTPVAYWP